MSTTMLAPATGPGTPRRASSWARTMFPPTWSAGSSWLIDSAIQRPHAKVRNGGRVVAPKSAYHPSALAVSGAR